MAKKRRKSAKKSPRKHRKHKKNPAVVFAHRGNYTKRAGHADTREERIERLKKALSIRKKLRDPKLAKIAGPAREHARKTLRKMQRQVRKGQSGYHTLTKKTLPALRKKGFTTHVAVETTKRVAKIVRREKKAKRLAAAAAKKRKAQKKRLMKARMAKARKTREMNKRKLAARLKKAASTRKKNKRKQKKHAAQARKAHPHRKHARRARRKHRRAAHGKHHGFKRNPSEGGKSMSAKLMEGLNKLTGGEAANAPYLVAASVGNDVISTAFQKALMKYAPGVLNTLAGVSPALPTYVLPVVPGLATALLASKSKNEKIRKFGQAVGLITLIDVIETVSSMISGPVMSAAGLSGVAFTPMGRRRGMHGVAYTPVGAVPRGLHAVPRGMQGVAFTPVSGLTSRDRADFGRQMADFGGENIRTAAGTVSTKADFGAIPQLRGAHTADAAICENDEDGNPEEGADHMI